MIAAVADTHTVIWYLYADKRLSSNAKTLIETTAQAGNTIGISSMTMLEMVYLVEKGRIAAESFSRLASLLVDPDSVFEECPVTLDIARTMARIEAAAIPDLPDRVIAATALDLGVPVISRDGMIAASSIQTVW